MAAALGGTQSLHTNGFDEALGLPTEQAAKIALRTQQIVGYESGIADTVDPLAGSWFVESLTDEVERAAWEYLERIDAMGGAVDAIEAQYMQQEIEQAAYAYAKAIDGGEKVVVGVNKFVDEDARARPRSSRSTPSSSAPRWPGSGGCGPSATRPAVDAALADVEAAARGTQNLLRPHEGGAAPDGHPGRGVRRAARGVRGVPARTADRPRAAPGLNAGQQAVAERAGRAASIAVQAMARAPSRTALSAERVDAGRGELGLVVDRTRRTRWRSAGGWSAPPARRWPCRSRRWAGRAGVVEVEAPPERLGVGPVAGEQVRVALHVGVGRGQRSKLDRAPGGQGPGLEAGRRPGARAAPGRSRVRDAAHEPAGDLRRG